MRRAPFIAVNCAGLTETLLESELFGHVKGSFTGAYRDKPGKLQLAHRGTLFLDEVGEMSLRMQALLLRFLENGEVQAVGSDHVQTKVDVRVIAATNRSPRRHGADGQFREDLLYRLRVIHIHVPPLRERREDIRPLVRFPRVEVGREGRLQRGCAQAARALPVAGQRPRAAEHRRAVAVDVERQRGSKWRTCRRRCRPAGDALVPMRERRRQVSDELYKALVSRRLLLLGAHSPAVPGARHDAPRHALCSCARVWRPRAATTGRCCALFGISSQDYKRFLNFLAAHECTVDFREFRHGSPPPLRAPRLLPPLEGQAHAAARGTRGHRAGTHATGGVNSPAWR